MKNPLLDKEFLYKLNQYQHKEIYAKIISLSFDERPLEQIEGRVTTGSINIDGNSAVRRTCSLTLIAKDVNITDFFWGVSNKFTLEIGVKNNINTDYPEIIWFKQGIYVISSFSSSLTHNNYSISISGKDKMCLLNGDVGGNLPSSVDFGKMDTYANKYSRATIEDYTQYKANMYYVYENGEYVLSTNEYDKNVQYYTKDVLLEQKDVTLKEIIKEAVHNYGKELYHNIIINDLDDYGLELLEYRGDTPLYLLYDEMAHIYSQMVIDKDFPIGNGYTIASCPEYNNAIDSLNEDRYIFTLEDGKIYSATKVEYGHTVGYKVTDLVYAGDLISSVGESLTSILDKIKNMLGPFEYFYDLDGHFVFQAKKIYAQNTLNLVEADGNVFARDAVEESSYSYSFEDVNLIQKFQNTPTINNVKNDYSIWGVRKSVTGAEVPIHARYAIHKKPIYYKAYDGKIYCSSEDVLEEIKEKEKENIINDINDRIQNFVPQYKLKAELRAPIRNEDGSWTPGWWDIRDWHDYYFALKQEEPRGTMKWYSHNSIEGCQRLLDVFPNDFSGSYYRNSYIWLIIVSPSGKINIQHGSGSPSSAGRTCTYYESFLQADGSYTTKQSSPLIQQYFIPPFSGCNDTHTYLEFLKNDVERNGNSVYFYNPNFPGAASFDEVVQDQIDREYEDLINSGKINFVDWREIIYQMAVDYYKHGQEKDYLYNVHYNNLQPDDITSYYPAGVTGYEEFYSDLNGFWRDLYDPNPKLTYDTEGGYYKEEKKYETEEETTYSIETVWVPFSQKETFTCDYYLKGTPESGVNEKEQNYSLTKYYWNKNTVLAPEVLNFWIDFYEGNDQLSQYSIESIGNRPKVVNNSKVTSIYFRNVPQIIFTNSKDYNALEVKSDYTYVWLTDEMQDLFSISAQGKSAEEEMNELFNNHSYCTEGISITTIPIYHLEPNTLIYIHNEENHISGKYQVNKITMPLTYNGTMSITATKVIEQI